MALPLTQMPVIPYIVVSATDVEPVSATNPLPITGSISATNPSVGVDNTTAPTSSTQIGTQDAGGKLQAVSATNPLPITGTISASNPSVSTTGSAVPASGTYIAANVAGTLTGLVATANGLKVDGSAVTQPVAGSGTAGTANAGVLTVQGIASMTKLLVTPDSVALPANQSVNVSQVNGVTTLTGAGATGTGSQRATVAQDTTTLAGSAPGTAGAASANVVTVQGVASMTPVQVSQATAGNLNATVVGTGTFVTQAAGTTASGSTLSSSPLAIGGRAATQNPTAVTDGQAVDTMHDKLGKLVAVGAIRILKGSQKTTLSNTTGETTIITAVASTFLDLYGLILANTGATTTKVDIRNATGGSIIATLEVPTLETRGFMLPVDSAVTQAIVNNNWTAQCAAATTAMEVTCFFVQNL